MGRSPAARDWLAPRVRDGVLRLQPIVGLAALSIIFAIAAGSEWMTPAFLAMGSNKPNPASLPLVLLGQSAVAVTVFYAQTAPFGLTLALGMSLLTWFVMPLNVLAAMIGDNFEGPGGAGGLFILFMLTQGALFFAAIVGLAISKRNAGGGHVDPWAITAVIGWALAFPLTDALF